jgi:mono/diheme cytochrome c family protein
MVIVIILAVVLIFLPLALWALNRARGSRPAKAEGEHDGRGSVNLVGILFVFTTLGFGIALPLLLLTGNHHNDSRQVHGVKLTAEARSGRSLFGQHCAVCHTLSAANAIGKVGPNLDTIHPPKALVLHTIANGCIPNASVKTENEACLGQGIMPAQVVTGQDAQDVAAFVAEAAKQHAPATSSASSGGSASASTSTSGGSSAGTSTSSSGGSSSSGGGAASAATLKAGMSVFESTCASCHTLAAAGSTGTVGPNLDQLKPSDALVTHQVTNGGGGMPAFGTSLSKAQIASVAAFVSSVAGKPVKGKPPKSSGGGGGP